MVWMEPVVGFPRHLHQPRRGKQVLMVVLLLEGSDAKQTNQQPTTNQ